MSADIEKPILVPDFELSRIVNSVLVQVRKNYNDAADKTQTMLHAICQANGLSRYKYQTEAVNLFINDETHPRFLTARLAFTQDKDNYPSIVIRQSSDNHGQNALSVEQGVLGYKTWNENLADPEEGTSWSNTYGRRYSSNYQLIFVSDNTNELSLMFHFFRSIFMSYEGEGYFEFLGFENLKMNGGDIQIKQDANGPLVAAKVLTMSFDYMTYAIGFEKYPFMRELIFEGTMTEDMNISTK